MRQMRYLEKNVIRPAEERIAQHNKTQTEFVRFVRLVCCLKNFVRSCV